jgi:hypothetical protein
VWYVDTKRAAVPLDWNQLWLICKLQDGWQALFSGGEGSEGSKGWVMGEVIGFGPWQGIRIGDE